MDTHSNTSENFNKFITWIHCNLCFELLIHKKEILFLLNCQHVLCKKCLKKASYQDRKMCPKCKKPVNCIPIDNAMPRNLKKFFKPDACKSLENLNDVIPFQIKHRDHFAKVSDAMNTTLKKFTEKLEKRSDYLKRLCDEQKKIKLARSRYEEAIQSLRSSRTRLSPEEVVRKKFSSSFQSSHSSGSGDKHESNRRYQPSVYSEYQNRNDLPFDNLNRRYQSQNDNKNYRFHYDGQRSRNDYEKKNRDISKNQEFFPFSMGNKLF